MKYFSLLITSLVLAILLFSPFHLVSANCAWVLNNSCSDLGQGFAEKTGADTSFCNNTPLVNGSTKKCCCGPDIKGCCLKLQDGKNYSDQLTVEQCRAITYATTTFYPGKKAQNNTCVTENGTTEPSKPSKVKAPVLQVSVPGFTKFSDVECDEQGEPCEIPWIAEYIQAIYKYSLLIIGILAVIVMMIGGIMHITASGNKERVHQANIYISSSVVGVILALCSYGILFLLNPKLTIFSPVNVEYTSRIELPEIDLSKSAEELNISESELTTLRGENPYQDGCGNIERCRQYGDTKPPGLVTVAPEHGGVLLNKAVYDNFKKTLACVNSNKVMFTIFSGWRSAKRQIEVKQEKGDLAATPCCSNHGAGVAMDLRTAGGGGMSWSYNDSSGLTRCMNQNGLYAKLKTKPNEPWHWSPTGR